MKPDAIMATNTSAIPLEQIGRRSQDASRLIGMHFFNPVPVLPLVEVVASEISRRDYVDRAMFVSGAMKKQPIRCKSSPGFLVNRALLPYLFGAIEAVNDGANPDMLDQALVAFGMPMGPIELCDQVGLDVCLDAGDVIGISQDAARSLKALVDSESLAGRPVPASMNGMAKRPFATVVITIRAKCGKLPPPLLRRLLVNAAVRWPKGSSKMRTWPMPPVFSALASRPSVAARCSGMKAVLMTAGDVSATSPLEYAVHSPGWLQAVCCSPS